MAGIAQCIALLLIATALALVALGLGATLVCVVWRVCRAHERLSQQFADVASAKPYVFLRHKKDGSLLKEHEITGRTISERKARAKAMENVTAGGLGLGAPLPTESYEEEDERIP